MAQPADSTGGDQASTAEKVTAAERVLNTTELLEMVLMHLPIKNMFGVLRVNKKFKATVDGSKGLQVAMFLRRDDSIGEERVNPLLDDIAYRSSDEFGHCVLYTGMTPKCRPFYDKEPRCRELQFKGFDKQRPMSTLGKGIMLCKGEDGIVESWEKMYVIQGVERFWPFYQCPGIRYPDFVQSDEMKLGSLFKRMDMQYRSIQADEGGDEALSRELLTKLLNYDWVL
ncbi:Hypothetical predicted protein [Lecanosticta acicola]|uniref:F-box domain-containing protein n=1 Tax=Lecanosticta acicola TaxID=111012 RepID=A0AAI8YYQ5_9PEZI|nr:Hypothetical predicted protein [Lecanosticta acicola]